MVQETLVQSKDQKNGTWSTLPNSQDYKVRIKGKMKQSREWGSAHPYVSV